MEENGHGMYQIQTFVFFDLETSGIDYDSRILELSMVAVSRNELLQMKQTNFNNSSNKSRSVILPRVLHKLTQLYYPRKLISRNIEEFTGLSNENLHHLSAFNEKSVCTIKNFLSLPAPVCLVAHNGNVFDFPILKAELNNVNAGLFKGLLCVDSLLFARQFEAKEIEILTKLAQEFSDDNFYEERTSDNSGCSLKHSNTAPLLEKMGASGKDVTQTANGLRPIANTNGAVSITKGSDATKDAASSPPTTSSATTHHSPLKDPAEILTSRVNGDIFKTPEKQIASQTPCTPRKKKTNASGKNPAAKRALYTHAKLKPFSQPSLYRRIFRTEYDAHRAESDALALLEICGFHREEFVHWADNNFTLFEAFSPRWNFKTKPLIL